MGQLDGRVALVSGGGRGIGRGISLLLASEGAAIAVNYRKDADAARATVAAIEASGGVAKMYEASIDDPDADAAMVEAVLAEFGFVDILICNAGQASRGMPVSDTDPTEVARLLGTHAIGPHHLCRLALPSMRTRPRGDIVMVSSAATTNWGPNGAPYNMGKAAMEALAYTLAKEERPNGIHVNIVAPGLVETDMGVRLARAITGRREIEDLRSLDDAMPFGRVCQPLDVANIVLWLCSDGAGYVTGQRIQCDAGGPVAMLRGRRTRDPVGSLATVTPPGPVSSPFATAPTSPLAPASPPSAPIIEITAEAHVKLLELRAEETDADRLGLRLEIEGESGDSFRYDLSFDEYTKAAFSDEVRTHDGLKVIIPGDDVEKLQGATLDYAPSTGLVIRNPNKPMTKRMEGLLHGDPLSAEIEALVASEINPALAAHGGFVTYVGHDGDGAAYMSMGGGCHGCSMSRATMLDGVQTMVVEQISVITKVVDVTDHSTGENPYYH